MSRITRPTVFFWVLCASLGLIGGVAFHYVPLVAVFMVGGLAFMLHYNWHEDER